MTKTDRAAIVSVLDTLKQRGFISRYTIDDTDGRPDWCEGGFEWALHEFHTNPQPLGLKKKGERAWLMMILAQKDKKAVDDPILNEIKQNYGL